MLVTLCRSAYAVSDPDEPSPRVEPVTTTIATIAAVTAIIGAGYAVHTWATDNFVKATVGQVCNPADGNPNNAWTVEDSGVDWASKTLKLVDVANDPCGSATTICWADDVWGQETTNDVWVRCFATPDPSSGAIKNAVDARGKAKADDFEVVGAPLVRHLGGQELESVKIVRTVEIDSLLMTSFLPPAEGDTLSAVWHAVFEYDGVPDTVFSAAVTWNHVGLSVTGGLSVNDLDFVGFEPGVGYVVKMFDYVFSDTTTHDSGTEFQVALPNSIDVHAEVDGVATAAAGSAVGVEDGVDHSNWGRIKSIYR